MVATAKTTVAVKVSRAYRGLTFGGGEPSSLIRGAVVPRRWGEHLLLPFSLPVSHYMAPDMGAAAGSPVLSAVPKGLKTQPGSTGDPERTADHGKGGARKNCPFIKKKNANDSNIQKDVLSR